MQNLKRLLPLVVLFTLVSGLLVTFSSALQAAHFDITVLIYANFILLT